MKRTNFYSQGQRRAARVLFIVWLLASCSLDVTLAVPRSEKAIVLASSPTPSDLPLASPPTAAWGHLAVAPRLPMLILGQQGSQQSSHRHSTPAPASFLPTLQNNRQANEPLLEAQSTSSPEDPGWTCSRRR